MFSERAGSALRGKRSKRVKRVIFYCEPFPTRALCEEFKVLGRLGRKRSAIADHALHALHAPRLGSAAVTEPRRPLPGRAYVEVTKARQRWFWTSRPAARLPLHDRGAAAADPALEFDWDSRSYRRKLRATPSPPLATSGPDPLPLLKVTDVKRSRPAAAKNKNANVGFQPGKASGARGRSRSRGRARGDIS